MMGKDKRVLSEAELQAINGGVEEDGYAENPFSVGDRVRDKFCPQNGIGEVTRITGPTSVIVHFPDVRMNIQSGIEDFEKV